MRYAVTTFIASKGALFCFSTDSVQFTENTLVYTYLQFVGEMDINTRALSHQPLIANLRHFCLTSIMYGTQVSPASHIGPL